MSAHRTLTMILGITLPAALAPLVFAETCFGVKGNEERGVVYAGDDDHACVGLSHQVGENQLIPIKCQVDGDRWHCGAIYYDAAEGVCTVEWLDDELDGRWDEYPEDDILEEDCTPVP